MKNKNIILFYILNFLQACVFTTPIWVFFFTSYHSFSLSSALFLIVLSWIFTALFEVPSGAWADRLWRKKMFIFWLSLVLIAQAFWIFSDTIILFMISALLLWIWFAFISWNYEALIHDDLVASGEESRFKDITANSYIATFLGRAMSALWAGLLFSVSPLYPIYGTVVAYLTALWLSFFITHPKQQISVHSNNFSHIFASFSFVKHNTHIWVFFIIFIIYWGVANIFWFTYQPFFSALDISIAQIWVIFAIISLISALWSFAIKKIQNKYSPYHITLWIITSLSISALLLSTFSPIFSLIWVVLLAFQSGFIFPFANKYLLQRAPKTQKSTILSLFSLGFTFSYTLLTIVWALAIDSIWIQNIYYINTSFILFLCIYGCYYSKKYIL